jgi:hypothetical protein
MAWSVRNFRNRPRRTLSTVLTVEQPVCVGDDERTVEPEPESVEAGTGVDAVADFVTDGNAAVGKNPQNRLGPADDQAFGSACGFGSRRVSSMRVLSPGNSIRMAVSRPPPGRAGRCG